MDTTALKNFATWARRELTREVDARLTSALAPGSTDRIERASAVAALEADIADSGDRDSILDKVSYTWFNRIIALRFMDANNYTGVGVVSSAYGQPLGQPEVLTEAKRGSVDPDVVHPQTRTKILELLDGTRRSNDPQGEAYRTLLAAYCGHWSKFMPFMFEREDAYTNLLMPGSLLADESVLNRTVEVLTPEVCEDVEVIGWLYQFYISERKQEVFAGFKAKGKARKLAGPDEIPAATQLFTPEWIVRYLVENSLGRLWMLNRPDSSLIDQMDYYIAPVDEEPDFLRIDSPEELTILDPACGSGHMLTYAFDLLYAIYEEEGYAPSEIPSLILTHNIYGTEIDERAGALAAFALTMKARAKQRRFFNKQVHPNVCVIKPSVLSGKELTYFIPDNHLSVEDVEFFSIFSEADTFGSLIQPDPELTKKYSEILAETQEINILIGDAIYEKAMRIRKQALYLTRRYAIVVANPPYMVSGNMNSTLARFADKKYPESKFDLMTMFIDRALNLTQFGGVASLVTRDAWMFLSRFRDFRRALMSKIVFQNLAHFGQGVFDGMSGAVVQVVGVCITPRKSDSKLNPGTYIRLNNLKTSQEKSAVLQEAAGNSTHPLRFSPEQNVFTEIPDTPIAYWIPPELRATFKSGHRVEDVAPVRQGFQTGDNDRFLRFWHEVSHRRIKFDATSVEDFHQTEARFAPYLKGGGFRKWYGNDDYIVAFDKSDYSALSTMGNKLPSRSLYFQDAVTWSSMSSGDFGARYAGPHNTFSGKGACAFPQDDTTRNLILAVFNSSVTRDLLEFMGATLDFEVGSLRQIPLPIQQSEDFRNQLSNLVSKIIKIHKTDWNSDEAAPGFTSLDTIERATSAEPLAVIAADLNSEWASLTRSVQHMQDHLDRLIAQAYGLVGSENLPVTLRNHSVTSRKRVVSLISYAVGCMFGRYSLNEPGLILADQGSTLEDYLAKVPAPTFTPDADNVIPIVDGDWFEDDIVSRFREFLRVAFGEQHFEENLRFVEESLGGKGLRSYFITSRGKSQFYEDHVRRYSKRPIYWLFSSPSGSFNALIYLHRYTPSTASTVLNEYLREYIGKLEASLQNHERNGETKEADHIRKILVELRDYEHAVLYPLASQQIALDLDDGVKMNYPKIGTALKKITGLGGGK